MSEDRRMDRRKFFREGLRELLRPLEKASGPLGRALKELEQLNRAVQGQPVPTPPPPRSQTPKEPAVKPISYRSSSVPASEATWLRPPGALPEGEFVDTCSRCGECARVCPVQCIKIEPAGRGGGLPFIDVNEAPCVLCDGLICMPSCPSGALTPLPLHLLDMGTAEWRQDWCMLTNGDPCTVCVDRCPVGKAAISQIEGRVVVEPTGCTGCGVCENACPTTPKSIVVIPAAVRDA